MKHQIKRGMSVMLVLVMIVGLLSGLAVPVQAADYVSNWGYRGNTATSLSSYATAFYASSGVTYEDLALLDGSSNVSAVPGSDLYNRLQTLMVSRHSHETDYNETRDMYKYTDCQGSDTTSISSFYSGNAIGPDWDSGSTWNREHTWPNSKGLGGNDENDIMMLRPTSVNENSARGNKAYGPSYYDPNSVSGGKYNLHGDVARIALYVYVRWGNTTNMWGADGVIESKDVLLSWIQEDPVDTWELGRNDAVQSITGTRNVFVDYPELAFLLFGEDVPSTMTTPSGKAGQSYEITATVNDETMGSVSLSGNNINAVPGEGYMVSGYEVVSGSATVTQTGNAFTVTALSDCTIQINFAPKTSVTVSYMDNGTLMTTETVYIGDNITLAAYTGTEPEGYTFLGWSDVPISHTETTPSFYKPSDTYTVADDATLYALFSYVASGDTTGSGVWTLVTDESQLAAGQKVVLASNEKNVVSAAIPEDKTYLDKTNATFSDDKSTILSFATDVPAEIFTLGGSANSWTFANEAGQLLSTNAVKKLYYDKGTTTWSISISNGAATIQNTTQSYGRILYNAGNSMFRPYTSNTSSSMLLPQLYMLDGSAGITYYTTASCTHENTKDVPAQNATCTVDGYTAGIYCNDCSTFVSGHEQIPAPGHNYDAVVTPPTATTDGYTTYTCSACRDSYTGDTVPALGETYTVSFSVPAGAPAVEDMTCNNSGITLPEAEVPADAADSYTFLGWTTEPVDNSTEMPEYHEAGASYVAPSHITLYALYSCTDGGTGERAYLLVETASQLTAGSRIVIASAARELALSTTQNGNNRGQAEITKNADKTITLGEGVAELVLGEGTKEGTWSFYCAANEGYLYAASSSSNHLKTQKTLNDNGSFTIVPGSNGETVITAQGTNTRNLLRYNPINKLFSCYGSGQEAVSLYIETLDGTVTYTTIIAHVHSGVYQQAVPATCTAAGSVAYYACDCGMKFADEACTQPLTDITVPQKSHLFTAETAEEEYRKAAANCESAAVYYISCDYCGLSSKGTQWDSTFLSGEVNPENHTGETYLSGQKDATCTIPGYTGDTHCSGCEAKLSTGELISASHSLKKENGVDPTHEEEGIAAHYVCSVCKKLFSDAEGTNEVTAAEVILQALGHTYGDYETSDTKHWKECSCGDVADEGKHTYGKWKTVKEAEENVEGRKQRSCTVCGYTQSKTIPASSTPVTGDAAIGLTLLIMVSATLGIFCLVTMRPMKGKYLR